MDLTSLSPVEIDTELAKLWDKIQTYANYAFTTRLYLETEQKRRHPDERRIADYEEQIAKYRAVIAVAREAAAPYQAEYVRRGRWNRYYLVTNGNGHVHRGTDWGVDCKTCYPTTQYAWLIDLADCDEEAMVVEYGEKACTVCFPDAPTNPAFHAPGRRDAAAKAEREAERAAKAAEKAAKAITDIDGSPLRVGYDILRTKVAARNALSNAVQSYGWYGPHPSDFLGQANKLIPALEAAGIDTAPVIDRAAKKVAKEGGTHDIRKVLAHDIRKMLAR